MSKAFTKDDGEDQEEQGAAEPVDTLPAGTKNYITPPGAEKMRTELKKLLDVDRPEVVRVVSWAAGNGDRSENADYIYGKRRLREIDRRIRFLQKRLEKAEIIDPGLQSGERVAFGATVEIEDESGNKRTFRIVGVDEIDAKRGHISWISPIGRALLKAKAGDSVTIRMPKGEEDFEILSVRYERFD